MNPRTPAYIAWLLFVPLHLLVPQHRLAAQIDDENRRYRLARGYEESGDWVNAGRVYKELYDADQNSNAYYEGLVRSWLAQARFNDLIVIVDERARRYPRETELHAFAAALYYRVGQLDEARGRWNRILGSAGSGSESTWGIVARYQMSAGAIDLAIETWRDGRKMLRSQDLFSEELGSALGVAGKIEEATAEYVRMLEFGSLRLPAIEQSMARFLTDRRAIERAIATVRSACDRRSDYQPFVELLGWLYQEMDDNTGALATAIRLDSLRRSNGSEVYRFADRMLSQDRSEPALQALEFFLSTYPRTNPHYPIVSLTYVRALERRYRQRPGVSLEEAAALVQRYRAVAEANSKTPLAAEALLRAIDILDADLSNPGEAQSIAYQVIRDFPRTPFESQARIAVGRLMIRLGDLDGARETLDSIAMGIVSPGDEETLQQALFLRGEIDFFTGNFGRAQDVFTGLTNNPTADVANDALEYGFLLSEHASRNEKALKEYAFGMLMTREAKWDEAAAAFVRVKGMARGTSLADRAQLQEGEAHAAAGRSVRAVDVLLDLVRSHPNGLVSDRALYRAAEVTERQLHDGAGALTLYLRLVSEFEFSPLSESARQHALRLRRDG